MEEVHNLHDIRIKTEPGLDHAEEPVMSCDQKEESIHLPSDVWTIVKTEGGLSGDNQPVVCKIDMSQERLQPASLETSAERGHQNEPVSADIETSNMTFCNGGVLSCASEDSCQELEQSNHVSERTGKMASTERRNMMCPSSLQRKRSLVVKRARFLKVKRKGNKTFRPLSHDDCPPLRKRSTPCDNPTGFPEERLKTSEASSFCHRPCSITASGVTTESVHRPSPGTVAPLFRCSDLTTISRPSSSSLTLPSATPHCSNDPCLIRSTCATNTTPPTPVQLFFTHESSKGTISGCSKCPACTDVPGSLSQSYDTANSHLVYRGSQHQSAPLSFQPSETNVQNQTPSGSQAFSELFNLVSGMVVQIQRLEHKVDSLLGKPRSSTATACTQTDAANHDFGGFGSSSGGVSAHSVAAAVAEADLAPVVVPENPVKQPVPQLSQSSQKELVPPVTELPFVDDRFWLIRPEQLSAQVTRDHLTQLTSTIVRFEPNCEALDLSEEELATIVRKSQSAASMARNLLFHCFTLGELFGRNATGINYTGGVGHKKKALNQKKLQELVALIRSHYDQEGLEKIIYTVLNKSILYLWSRKLKHPWLFLVEV